eukprot:27691-Chlamydomonas_euryale.AAC.1
MYPARIPPPCHAWMHAHACIPPASLHHAMHAFLWVCALCLCSLFPTSLLPPPFSLPPAHGAGALRGGWPASRKASRRASSAAKSCGATVPLSAPSYASASVSMSAALRSSTPRGTGSEPTAADSVAGPMSCAVMLCPWVPPPKAVALTSNCSHAARGGQVEPGERWPGDEGGGDAAVIAAHARTPKARQPPYGPPLSSS